MRRCVVLDTADDRLHQSFVSWSPEVNCEDVTSLSLLMTDSIKASFLGVQKINCEDLSSLTLLMTDSIEASFLGVQK